MTFEQWWNKNYKNSMMYLSIIGDDKVYKDFAEKAFNAGCVQGYDEAQSDMLDKMEKME